MRAIRACVVVALAAWAVPAAAQVEPSPIIAPVVFHWVQAQTPWLTLEGGSVAGASVLFWRRQVRLMERAGFNAQLFQVAYGSEASQRNHLEALRQLAAERGSGPLPPRLAPFFAAESFAEYGTPKDVLTPEGFEAFYQTVRAFFVMYAEYFPAPGRPGVPDTTMLARVGGKVFAGLWWVPLTDYRLPGDFFVRLNDRVQADFGFRLFWSAHEAWLQGDPDDINYLFNGAEPLQRGRHPLYASVDLLAGFWPPNLESYKREFFVPRGGGATFAAAWDAVIASRPRPDIVLVESYNEITEGSHIMPSWPVSHFPGDSHWRGPVEDLQCVIRPCHPVEYTDTWGPDNPWHFLDLTRRRIDEWLVGTAQTGADRVPPHAFILWPKTGEGGGGTIEVRAVVGDDQAVGDVNVYLDGFLLFKASGATGTVTRLLKTSFLTNGLHRLRVEVFDKAGNRDDDESVFIVQNPWVGPATAAVGVPVPIGTAADGPFTRATGPAGPLCRSYEAQPGATPGAWELREVVKPCLQGGR
jgi:hypothetical protein